jgi:hypothetical protein
MQRPSPSGSARAGGEVPEHGRGFARPVVGYLIFRGALHALVTSSYRLLYIILFGGFQGRRSA